MKLTQKTLVAAMMMALGSGVAYADNSSRVVIDKDIEQKQNSNANGSQTMDLGNVTGTGTTDVLIQGKIEQEMNNEVDQTIKIGNVTDGGTVGKGAPLLIKESVTQKGEGKGTQTLTIGNASNGGTVNDVSISGAVLQSTTKDANVDQTMHIGNAGRGGNSNVSIAKDVTQTSGATSGAGGGGRASQFMQIGYARHGKSDVIIKGAVTQEQAAGSSGSQTMRVGNVTGGAGGAGGD